MTRRVFGRSALPFIFSVTETPASLSVRTVTKMTTYSRKSPRSKHRQENIQIFKKGTQKQIRLSQKLSVIYIPLKGSILAVNLGNLHGVGIDGAKPHSVPTSKDVHGFK
jgi:hypothetical protein